MLELYYYPENASLAPHLLLAELQFDYTLRLVDRDSNEQKSEEYLKLNPAGRIPTLVHNELVLFESPAICVYISELDVSSRFIPPIGHANRPLFFQWLTYLTNTLQAELMVWHYPNHHTTDVSNVKSIKQAQDLRLVDIFNLLDKELSKKMFLLGSEISACDHFLFMVTLWCEGISKPPISFTNIKRFMVEMSQRPAIKKVCEFENINVDIYQ